MSKVKLNSIRRSFIGHIWFDEKNFKALTNQNTAFCSNHRRIFQMLCMHKDVLEFDVKLIDEVIPKKKLKCTDRQG